MDSIELLRKSRLKSIVDELVSSINSAIEVEYPIFLERKYLDMIMDSLRVEKDEVISTIVKYYLNIGSNTNEIKTKANELYDIYTNVTINNVPTTFLQFKREIFAWIFILIPDQANAEQLTKLLSKIFTNTDVLEFISRYNKDKLNKEYQVTVFNNILTHIYQETKKPNFKISSISKIRKEASVLCKFGSSWVIQKHIAGELKYEYLGHTKPSAMLYQNWEIEFINKVIDYVRINCRIKRKKIPD